jgi:hypothetical protein
VTTVGSETATMTDDVVRSDLSDKNLLVRFRIRGTANLSDLNLELSNDGWTTTISNNLRNAYPVECNGQWLTLSIGKGGLRDSHGGYWRTDSAGAFDWSAVDGIRFVLEPSSTATGPSTFALGGISTTPAQPRGAVVFVFDDGYNSVLPAASYMHLAGMAGNVGVIGKYVELPTQDHLTTDVLRRLQDDWGWDMVNHTQTHADAVAAYRHPLRLDAYAQDILDTAQFLEQEHLNSAPNWFIYPHGRIDAALEVVVRRFYKFARTTDNEPEAYPFGDPLRVKTLLIEPSDSEGQIAGIVTTPAQVERAVLDAKRYGLTLILTFHRIHSEPADPPGFPMRYFKEIVDGVRRTHIAVVTLSGLDQLMGVPEDNRIEIQPAVPSQIVVSVREQTHQRSFLRNLWSHL